MANLIVREQVGERSLRDVCYIVCRHKRKAAWFFLSILAVVTLITLLMPEVYQSEAKLLVRLGRESVSLDPSATNSQVAQVTARRESEIKSELEILRSRDLAEKVVDALGPEKVAPSSFLAGLFSGDSNKAMIRDNAVRHLMKKWDIDVQRESNIITINYEAGSPEAAQAIVAELVNFYLDKHLAVNRTPGSHGFFRRQTDHLQTDLANAEKELMEAKNKTGLASVPEQRRILLERMGGLQKDLDQSKTDFEASNNKIKTMRGLLSQMPQNMVTGKTTGFTNYAADGMRQKLYELQLKEQELLSKYTEKNFLVQETRRQITDAKSLLDKEQPTRTQVTTGLNTSHENMKLALATEQAIYASLKTKAEQLTGHLASAREELRLLNQNEIHLAQLQRKMELNETNFRKYSEKMEQARIDEALETQKISNISVVQAATLPLKPTRPHKGLNLALGFAFAAVGALGFAFAAEHMDHSFKRPEDVEKRLNLPVFATIPQLTENGLMEGSQGVTLPVLRANPLVWCGQMAELGEIYDTLCDRLINASTPNSPNIIGVTSCHGGEGVSTVAANLALALSRKPNQRILLVDTNVQNPTASSAISGIKAGFGLMDMIAEGKADFSQTTFSYSNNLDIIPPGQGNLTLAQLADSQEFIEMLNYWQTEYSFVVFDLPPLKSNATLRLASLAQGLLLVVGAETVKWEAVQNALSWLSQGQVKVLGAVFNKRLYHIPDWLYRKL